MGRWVILLGLLVSSSLHAQPRPGDFSPSSVPAPTVRLADVDAAYVPYVAPAGDAQPLDGPRSGVVEIAVYSSNPTDVNGLALQVDYDEIFMKFLAYRKVSDAWIPTQQVSYHDNATGGRVKITFSRYSGRGDVDENGEILVGYLQFALNEVDPSALTPSPLPVDVRLEAADSSSYYYRIGPDGSGLRVDTDLTDGTVLLFSEDQAFLGSGVVSPVEQNIAVPLYVTVLNPNDSEVLLGVDYDEIFMELIDAEPVEPRVIDGEGIVESPPAENEGTGGGPASTTLTFTLNAEEIEGPLLRRHVADLIFTYSGGIPSGGRLNVSAQLLSTDSPTEPQDKGTRERIVAHIEIGSPYFVRGNVSARYDLLPDDTYEFSSPALVDVQQIFQYLMAGGTLGCKTAADTDDNGVVNVTDGIMLLGYLFGSGLPPAAPFPESGALTDYETELGCDTSLPYFYAKQ